MNIFNEQALAAKTLHSLISSHTFWPQLAILRKTLSDYSSTALNNSQLL